ncbi:MAG: DUF1552 domain-containing protein [Planctomycetales bacterium]|nr:DUF1552 domain-containing protein [Planctomycetales bacterium]
MHGIDRRRFLRGSGLALALPLYGSLFSTTSRGESTVENPRRLACFYFPDGVPMPLAEDSAFQEWAWFPHGGGNEFTLTNCMSPLESLKSELTVLSGFSHPRSRSVHGHNNADQFLTAAATGGGDTDYHNTISLDQEYVKYVGDRTRIASLVMSTDGGTGTARGAHTISFDRHGRAIPAEHRPKQIFDMLFVKANGDSRQRLALSRSALDEMLADARDLRESLSVDDRRSLDEYLDAVRQAEIKVEKAKRWLDVPLPSVAGNQLNLELSTDEPRQYLQTMFELIYLAFKTDSTRVATLLLAYDGSNRSFPHLGITEGHHFLTHNMRKEKFAEHVAKIDQFYVQRFARFLQKLADTEDVDGTRLLDNCMILYGGAIGDGNRHTHRNLPAILAGGGGGTLRPGRYVKLPSQPMSNLFVSMLDRMGASVDSFGDSTGRLEDI